MPLTLELGADLGVAVETLLANVRRDGIMFRSAASGPAAKCAAMTSRTSSALRCCMRTVVPRASLRIQNGPRAIHTGDQLVSGHCRYSLGRHADAPGMPHSVGWRSQR